MAMLPYLDWYDHTLPYLPGAETGVLDFHIRKILREFLRRTTVWRETITLTPLVGSYSYALVPANPGAIVAAVLSVGDSGNMNHFPVLPENYRPAPGYADASRPRGWYVQALPYINLYGAIGPTGVQCVLTLTLEPGVLEFPDFLLNQYSDIIGAGIVASMMAMPGKPWTQFEVAQVHWRRYVNGMLALRAELRDGGQPNSGRFTGPRFGA